MPFTLAHPAAVIPFKKNRYGQNFLLSALIMGSVVPDIGYFIPLSQFVGFTHSFWGVIWFGLPTGLLILWAFHNILKKYAVMLLPNHHRQVLINYCKPFPFLPWRRFLLIIGSLWTGALTHIIWDSMTHGSGWFVQHVPLFLTVVPTFSEIHTRFYFVFKHTSTLIGITLLIHWYWQWYRHQNGNTFDQPSSRLTKALKLIGFIIFVFVGGMTLATLSLIVGYGIISLVVRWTMVGLGSIVIAYTILLSRSFKSRLISKDMD